ncbi:MAG: hypothetical protein HY569_02825 [Candidatus Magasanikbacteria bacterium]|nr:hypothetical protein [Candidatus Magasanikbacteria bacterium]
MFIISTVSRLSSNPAVIKKMLLAGTDILRFNLSYGTLAEKIEAIDTAKTAIQELNAHIKILIDLPNPKIRLGGFSINEVYVRAGQQITLSSGSFSNTPDTNLPVQLDNIGDVFYPEQTIIIDEGEISLKVIDISSRQSAECIFLNSGTIYPYKGLNWKNPDNQHIETHINSIIQNFLPQIIDLEPNYLGCPFVDTPEIAQKYNKAIKNTAWKTKPKIILKIETENAINHLEEIVPFGDLILLERGNLGLEGSYEKLGVYQKTLIKICRTLKKPIIISTQILESTIHNFIPQRSEIVDLTNMVTDRVDGIMLCHETGVSSRPAYPVSVARKIIVEAEKYIQNYGV